MKKNEVQSRTEVHLRERVKELTCLYGIARIAASTHMSRDEILQGFVDLLPPGWQYSDICAARIVIDGLTYETLGFRDVAQKQSADIIVSGVPRGAVEVVYMEEKPELDEGPFLKEERNLIDAVAREVEQVVERWDADAYKAQIQSQLRHADRLATIGLLAAGVAHELNEPLGSILGFAQLAKKNEGLPEQVKEDIEKIETASLHAREVIKNLLVFARQVPPQKIKVNINQLVQNGLYFFESRCSKDGVEVNRLLSFEEPEIIADPAQMNQVLVNLIVNALQSMPVGGKLTIQTLVDGERVSLIVKDTGCGMDEETLDKVFVPFFTTKDVGQGTGLGLPVVHGIVTAHGGTIDVTSKVGEGTQFEIHLPVSKSAAENEVQ